MFAPDSSPDLLNISELSVKCLNQRLRQRYEQNQIYSYVGQSVLLAMNPYKEIPDLYDTETAKLYVSGLTNEPHPFSIAQHAYENVMKYNTLQNIIISGESGSGKTETTKFMLSYFASLVKHKNMAANNSRLTADENKEANRKLSVVEHIVLQCNPIFEAFGNCRTEMNDNSSRFGRYIQLFFNQDIELGISKVSITYYLLEKCRVMAPLEGMNNFHVFYMILAGLDGNSYLPRAHHSWKMDRFTNAVPSLHDEQISCQYRKGFNDLIASMFSAGLSYNEIQKALAVSCGLLHLLTVEIRTTEPKDCQESKLLSNSSECYIHNPDAFRAACELLDFHFEDTEHAILHKRLGGKIGLSAPRTCEEATDVRNTLVKEVYSLLFDKLVYYINRNTDNSTIPGDRAPICLLDIYGFEVFQRNNSIEQLCINFANEKIQNLYNSKVLLQEQRDYMDENIEWQFVDHESNDEILECLGSSRRGLFGILTDIRTMGRVHDSVILDLINENCNPRVVTVNRNARKRCSSETFTIKHFCRDVEYHVNGIIQKNTERLDGEAAKVLYRNSNWLVDHKPLASITTVASRSTVTGIFCQQLDQLINDLSTGTTWFVRCIKPNSVKKPLGYDSSDIIRQLASSGIIEALRIRKLSYKSKLKYSEIVEHALPLLPLTLRRDARQLLAARDNYGLMQIGKSVCKHIPCKYGKTLLVSNTDVWAQLSIQRNEKLTKAVIRIQSWHKMRLKRLRFLRIKAAAVPLQSAVRCYLARKIYAEKRYRKEGVTLTKTFFNNRSICSRLRYREHVIRSYKTTTKRLIPIESKSRCLAFRNARKMLELELRISQIIQCAREQQDKLNEQQTHKVSGATKSHLRCQTGFNRQKLRSFTRSNHRNIAQVAVKDGTTNAGTGGISVTTRLDDPLPLLKPVLKNAGNSNPCSFVHDIEEKMRMLNVELSETRRLLDHVLQRVIPVMANPTAAVSTLDGTQETQTTSASNRKHWVEQETLACDTYDDLYTSINAGTDILRVPSQSSMWRG